MCVSFRELIIIWFVFWTRESTLERRSISKTVKTRNLRIGFEKCAFKRRIDCGPWVFRVPVHYANVVVVAAFKLLCPPPLRRGSWWAPAPSLRVSYPGCGGASRRGMGGCLQVEILSRFDPSLAFEWLSSFTFTESTNASRLIHIYTCLFVYIHFLFLFFFLFFSFQT